MIHQVKTKEIKKYQEPITGLLKIYIMRVLWISDFQINHRILPSFPSVHSLGSVLDENKQENKTKQTKTSERNSVSTDFPASRIRKKNKPMHQL